jgi:NAD(P)-dependent dehydrogenase (short-subunit alcohol dehydrogenase family)
MIEMTYGAAQGLAIVTGAAAGMGAASATRLAAEGWPLILCDLDAARLDRAANEIRDRGGEAEVLAGDISDPSFPDRLVALIGERPIGAVIHAAGLSPTRGDSTKIFAVNYDATLRLLRVVQPRIAEGACAVLISSSSAYSVMHPKFEAAIAALGLDEESSALLDVAPDPGLAYALSKLGVLRMVERHAPSFGARGARIMSISPGLIDTEMGRAEQKAHPIMDEQLAKTPLGRYGTADEIASVAVFLCSPGASYVSGSDVKVDGGVIGATRW